jgi:SAM-dependent methyltransferase
MIAPSQTHADVRHYYGEILQSTCDLKTGACCNPETLPPYLRKLIGEVHPEVRERFYGCGSPLPPALEGCSVLDLGCGSGRDCFVLSKLVGPSGRVIGLDMTPEQLTVARRHVTWHTERYGYASPNVEFREGIIEDLRSARIEDASVDVVVSNCVLNLSPQKPQVFAEVFRVLRPGGELYFSDVFSDRRIPEALRHDPVLLGECLAGALYNEDFRRLLVRLGCADVRTVTAAPIPLLDPEIEARIGFVNFRSLTLRAFKLELEDRCEDFGQVATYLGGIEDHPHAFVLDDHHRFETGRPLRVCGNTADMLGATRYARYFQISGDKQRHFGLFDCVPAAAFTASSAVCC